MKKSLLQGVSIFALLMLVFLDTASALDAKEIVGNFRENTKALKASARISNKRLSLPVESGSPKAG